MLEFYGVFLWMILLFIIYYIWTIYLAERKLPYYMVNIMVIPVGFLTAHVFETSLVLALGWSFLIFVSYHSLMNTRLTRIGIK